MSRVFLLLLCAAFGCSSQLNSEQTAKTSEALTVPTTIQLQTPKGMAVFAPVLLGSHSVTIGASAQVARPPSAVAPAVSLSVGGIDAEPDAMLDDVWSRGPVTLRDRVQVQGLVHAASVIQGNSVVIAGGVDKSPVLDPPTTLKWNVQWPTVTGPDENLAVNQAKSVAPGAFGAVTVPSGAQLSLSTGTYYFTSLDLEPHATIRLNQDAGPVVAYVAGSVIYRGAFTTSNAAPPDFALAALSNTTVFVEAPYNGALLAPSGAVVLRQGSHVGYFAAQDVSVDAHAVVQYRAPNALLAAAGLGVQACVSQLAPRGDLTGRPREVAFQSDIARYCSMAGADACRVSIVARTNVDYATIAFSLFAETATPATYLAVVRDRARKEAAAQDDPVLASLLCTTGDQDGDLVPDSRDNCPNTPPLTPTFDNGCTDPTVPLAPSASGVSTLFAAEGSVLIDPRCANAAVLPDSIAGAFYKPARLDLGTYIIAGRVTNQPAGCSVWYAFDIEEYTPAATGRRYQVAFAPQEESSALVGLSSPVPPGYIQFNPLPGDLGTRGFLGSVGGKVRIRFRVRVMNGGGQKSDWSEWKVTTLADCLHLGFRCEH
jgi:hypothetical protein